MENEETYLRRRNEENFIDEIREFLILALIVASFTALSCFSLASAYYSGETIEKNATDFDLFYFSNVWIQENDTFINLTWTNETFKVIIPETYVGNIRVAYQGYNDKPQIITDSYSGGGGSSYLPKESIVIYPNSTNNSQSAIHSAIDNETNPESAENVLNNTQESQSLFGRFWDWLVNLFRRLFG